MPTPVSHPFLLWLSSQEELVVLGPIAPLSSLNTLSLPPALSNQEWVFAIDGGRDRLSHYPSLRNSKVFSIGDGDSSSFFEHDLLYPPEKDDSDLALGLDLILSHSTPERLKKIHFLGFWGGERDHEWMNLGEIYERLLKKTLGLEAHALEVFLYSEKNQLILQGQRAGQTHFHHQGVFSLFSFEAWSPRIQGEIRYPLEGQKIIKPFSSHLLSNEARGDFQVHSQTPFFIYFRKPLVENKGSLIW